MVNVRNKSPVTKKETANSLPAKLGVASVKERYPPVMMPIAQISAKATPPLGRYSIKNLLFQKIVSCLPMDLISPIKLPNKNPIMVFEKK